MSNTENSIKNMSSVEVSIKSGKIYCLTIVGEIEGHMNAPGNTKTTKYEHVIPELVRIEQDKETDGLLLMLNTIGGDVEAGLAIAELVASMRKPTVSVVLGGGHSIGVPLAVSTKKSFIVPSATMVVHPIRSSGVTITSPQSFSQMTKLQDRLINFITGHSHAEKSTINELMLKTGNIPNDTGTMLCGTEAVECGLIDKVGGISDAIDEITAMIKSERKTEKN